MKLKKKKGMHTLHNSLNIDFREERKWRKWSDDVLMHT
jgi:hypothetical protein